MNSNKILDLKNKATVAKLKKWLAISIGGAALMFGVAYIIFSWRTLEESFFNDKPAMIRYLKKYLETEQDISIFMVAERGRLRYAGYQVTSAEDGTLSSPGVAIFEEKEGTRKYYPLQVITPEETTSRGDGISVAYSDNYFICLSISDKLAEIEVLYKEGAPLYLEVSTTPYMLVLEKFEGEYNFYDRYGVPVA